MSIFARVMVPTLILEIRMQSGKTISIVMGYSKSMNISSICMLVSSADTFENSLEPDQAPTKGRA